MEHKHVHLLGQRRLLDTISKRTIKHKGNTKTKLQTFLIESRKKETSDFPNPNQPVSM